MPTTKSKVPDDYTAWAHAVFTGDSLAAKLVPPVAGGPPPAGVPDLPGRPVELAFAAPGETRRAEFPGERALHDAEARGRVFHFFANHELLALELMAWALVRFPEAPPAFRRGLVGIIADEQRHLASYVTCMNVVGVQFGDLPLNRYLWDALQGASPIELVAGLSLTFEQANLDYACQYAEAFRRVGDEPSAVVLDGVLADEIRHVAHGLAWFDRWRDPGKSRWECWNAALRSPLTPARAKGPRFFRDPRVEAGLDAATIEATRLFGASVGRPPRVFSFNPEAEAEVLGQPPTAVGAAIARDFASLMILNAARGDVVLVPKAPTSSFLGELARAGVTIPEIVEGGVERVTGRKIGGLAPWAHTPATNGWDPRWRPLYEKSWSVERLRERPDLCDPAVVGVVCRSWEEVVAAATEDHVCKAPLGTAGRAMTRWRGPASEAWVRRVLDAQGAVVVEPWLDRRLDLSLQFDVHADGVRCEPWGRFLTDARGHYEGAVLGQRLAEAPQEVRRLLAEHGDRLDAIARHLGEAMANVGYVGPAGIDALVYQTPDGPRLKPLVELNPRVTMGRFALALDRRVRRGKVGLWVQRSNDQLRKLGFAGIPAWAAAIRSRAPLVVAGEPAQVTSGALFTSDPDVAERWVTVLVVADSLAACRSALNSPV